MKMLMRRCRTAVSNVSGVIVTCVVCLSLHASAQNASVVMPDTSERVQTSRWKLPKGQFHWKALWSAPLANKTETASMVALTKRMGFNVIIAQPDDDLIREAHRQGLQFYAWIINLRGSSPEMREFYGSHPEYLQKVRPEEEALVNAPRIRPDRVNIHAGNWLCPDRGLLAIERVAIEDLVRNHDIDGLGLDYVGYRNYYACFCDYSRQRHIAYAQKHPELSPKEALHHFSEESLIEYVRQVRECAHAINPDLNLAIHIYPDFDPSPSYGNRLPVEYSGMTVAWFYKPFWSFEMIMQKTLLYRKGSEAYPVFNRYVPFIGVYPGTRLKPAERLRTEIRIAAKSGTDAIMLAFYDTFRGSPELVNVIVEELGAETVQGTKDTGAASGLP